MKTPRHQVLFGAAIAAALTICASDAGSSATVQAAMFAPCGRERLVQAIRVCADDALWIALDAAGEIAPRFKQL